MRNKASYCVVAIAVLQLQVNAQGDNGFRWSELVLKLPSADKSRWLLDTNNRVFYILDKSKPANRIAKAFVATIPSEEGLGQTEIAPSVKLDTVQWSHDRTRFVYQVERSVYRQTGANKALNDSASLNGARIAIGGLKKEDAKLLPLEWAVGTGVPRGFTVLGWAADDSGILVRHELKDGKPVPTIWLHRLDGTEEQIRN